MKVFMVIMQAQAWDREQLEPREYSLKAIISDNYSGKSHINCYHFCQQCEDYFKTSGATRINHTPFPATFFRDTVNLRWAQQKRRHKSATPIT